MGVIALKKGGTILKEYVEMMEQDVSLVSVKGKADKKKEGYFWRGNVLVKTVEDGLQGQRDVIVIPQGQQRRYLHLHMIILGILAPRKCACFYDWHVGGQDVFRCHKIPWSECLVTSGPCT